MHGIGNNFYILHTLNTFSLKKSKVIIVGFLFLSSCADINKIPKESVTTLVVTPTKIHWWGHSILLLNNGCSEKNKTQNSFF